MTHEEQIQAAYERGFTAGFKAAKAESPQTIAERAREQGGRTDARGTFHPRGCDCMSCHEL